MQIFANICNGHCMLMYSTCGHMLIFTFIKVAVVKSIKIVVLQELGKYPVVKLQYAVKHFICQL